MPRGHSESRDEISREVLTVVSMLEVMIRLGERLFQSKEVRGAVCSGDFELESNARGVSFWGGNKELLDERVIELP